MHKYDDVTQCTVYSVPCLYPTQCVCPFTLRVLTYTSPLLLWVNDFLQGDVTIKEGTSASLLARISI